MIKAKLFLCADSAALDARINTISAFHIFEQINGASFPLVVPRISIIALLLREEADSSTSQLQLQVHLGDQQLFVGPVDVNFLQQLTTRTLVEMHGIVVSTPGTLSFVLKQGTEIIGSWAIIVNQIGQPAGVQMYLPVPPVTSPSQVQ